MSIFTVAPAVRGHIPRRCTRINISAELGEQGPPQEHSSGCVYQATHGLSSCKCASKLYHALGPKGFEAATRACYPVEKASKAQEPHCSLLFTIVHSIHGY